MSDDAEGLRGSTQLETMFAKLAEEQRKLAEFQRRMAEASTVVESSNKMVTATFDGRGELTDLKFNNTKYRTMAQKELATVLVETLKKGRTAAFGKIDEMAGGDVLPGVKFGDLAAGKTDINEVVGSLMTAAVDLPGLAETVRGEAGRHNG